MLTSSYHEERRSEVETDFSSKDSAFFVGVLNEQTLIATACGIDHDKVCWHEGFIHKVEEFESPIAKKEKVEASIGFADSPAVVKFLEVANTFREILVDTGEERLGEGGFLRRIKRGVVETLISRDEEIQLQDQLSRTLNFYDPKYKERLLPSTSFYLFIPGSDFRRLEEVTRRCEANN